MLTAHTPWNWNLVAMKVCKHIQRNLIGWKSICKYEEKRKNMNMKTIYMPILMCLRSTNKEYNIYCSEFIWIVL